ncbi:4Fe-4S ferredoxin [candidate division KSB1 bacterium]|nr:4Fe-4S ferredoxin [candidate division KSB1 bacterium]NIR70623.1 4Fe-4S ferredoxin [candidate division KSB1 bacterium]NIS23428.1 4Fe-4S ferredoxin [candidate division KSB1 bacterium]NIT74563.1 4Fe-4S ferredoxin [candidate division KSB1 bacterium]NIU28390.1 4Fe-4S ferredoxin [candidate division KSB1 bacterium]
MKQLSEHPTVINYNRKSNSENGQTSMRMLQAEWLKQLCLDAGADDVGFVEIDRWELADQRDDILSHFPQTRSLISFVCRLNREPIRSSARSVANLEFHHAGDHVNEVARNVIRQLETHGVRAISPAMGFPMEMDRFPGKIWVVSHKPVAVAAGLGHMGIHRNVIHPRFGNFILLGTILVDTEVSEYSQPLDYNPCLECKLCVAACPTGAISPDGHFDFSACYTHNYREFMGGFTDWVESIADSGNAREYRRKVSDSESVSMWQSLSYGANYKAAYCMAVCPAGEDVIGPYLSDKSQHLQHIVKPFQIKDETVYVVPNSDAETHVARRFPNKETKRVGNGLRPQSIQGFLNGLALTFQRDKSKTLEATYHFAFTGKEQAKATVVIQNKTLQVRNGHVGEPDLRVVADSETWLKFLAKERSIFTALLFRKIRVKGSPRLLLAFGKCFPS